MLMKVSSMRLQQMERKIDISLHNCDCERFMAGIPDNHFDLTIADTPYGIGKDA